MAHSYSYEDEEYFGDQPPFFDETLAGALDNTVQISINKALERALGPLTVQFENFARQKGWLSHIASSEALSDQPSTSKGKAKAKSWPHSDIFKKFASSIQEDHGHSFSQAQEAYSSDSDQSPSKSSGSDSEEDLGPKSSAGHRQIRVARRPRKGRPWWGRKRRRRQEQATEETNRRQQDAEAGHALGRAWPNQVGSKTESVFVTVERAMWHIEICPTGTCGTRPDPVQLVNNPLSLSDPSD
ncbi:hypothetical protein NDU88_001984 [Pleurodeles waltl]|uniref:Uncharacterized protein n=1 Tax=Pleurodeles waltl TaxID=8319 RepID=A0AAV7KU32_PLEWA|nr:hypothetical protein NDU88_001984 [Pleurodeles waltl]